MSKRKVMESLASRVEEKKNKKYIKKENEK